MWKRLFIMGETNLAMVDTHTRMTVMKARITFMHLPRSTLAFTVSVCRACCSCWWSSSLEMRVWQDSKASCGQEGEQGHTLSGPWATLGRVLGRAGKPPRLRTLDAEAASNSPADEDDDKGGNESQGSFIPFFVARTNNHKIPETGAYS